MRSQTGLVFSTDFIDIAQMHAEKRHNLHCIDIQTLDMAFNQAASFEIILLQYFLR